MAKMYGNTSDLYAKSAYVKSNVNVNALNWSENAAITLKMLQLSSATYRFTTVSGSANRA